MNVLSQSAFLKALGWALVNSLWQFGLLWMVFVLLVNNTKRLSSSLRHGIALLLLSTGFIWFGAGLSYQYFAYTAPDAYSAVFYLPGEHPAYTSFLTAVQNIIQLNLPYISGIYLLMVTALLLQFFSHYYKANQLITTGLSKISARLRLHVYELSQQLGIRRKVQVWVSAFVDTPMVIGFFTPVILMPMASINRLSVQQLEAILLHELAHIKRNDYLVNVYVAITAILFFFNPFSRMLVNAIKRERENSCDDWVLQFRFDPYQYASALLTLEKSRTSESLVGLAATSGNSNVLLHRIQRIMNTKTANQYNGLKFTAYLFTILLLSFVALVNPGNALSKKVSAKEDALRNMASVASWKKDKGHIQNITNTAAAPAKNESMPVASVELTHPIVTENMHAEDDPAIISVSNTGDDDPAYQVTETVASEVRDYSIPDITSPPLPPAAMGDVPFVPNSSFSAFTFDTSKPLKLTPYAAHSAGESLAKAQKALEQLDWATIQKQFSNKKTDAAKLLKQIQESLKKLNWQQINEEVQAQMEKENTDQMRASLKAAYDEMARYKNEQQEYIKIKSALLKQVQQVQKDIEKNQLELDKKVVVKKVIVHI